MTSKKLKFFCEKCGEPLTVEEFKGFGKPTKLDAYCENCKEDKEISLSKISLSK